MNGFGHIIILIPLIIFNFCINRILLNHPHLLPLMSTLWYLVYSTHLLFFSYFIFIFFFFSIIQSFRFLGWYLSLRFLFCLLIVPQLMISDNFLFILFYALTDLVFHGWLSLITFIVFSYCLSYMHPNHLIIKPIFLNLAFINYCYCFSFICYGLSLLCYSPLILFQVILDSLIMPWIIFIVSRNLGL